MCGRFYLGEKIEAEVSKIATKVDPQMKWRSSGDIHPSEQAVVISGFILKTLVDQCKIRAGIAKTDLFGQYIASADCDSGSGIL